MISFFISVITAGSLVFVIPLSGYLSHSTEYSFTWEIVARSLVIPTIFFSVFLFFFQMGLTKYIKRNKKENVFVHHISYSNILVLLVSMMIWLEGMFLTRGLPILDGKVDNFVSPVRLLLSMVIILLTFIIGTINWRKLANNFLVCVLLMIVSYGLVLADGYREFLVEAVADDERIIDRNSILNNLKIGKENTYVFVVDALSTALLTDYVEAHSEKDLTGFTLYKNNLQSAQSTQYALSTILRGEMYTGGNGVVFQQESLSEDNTLIGDYVAKESNVYVSSILSRFNYTNDLNGKKFSQHSWMINPELLMELGFKYLPYAFKNQVANRLGFTSQEVAGNKITDKDFFKFLNASKVEKKMASTFQFHHINGSHKPYIYEADGHLLPQDEAESLSGLKKQTAYVLGQLFRFFDRLKKEGVYEESTIIIMGDHGDRFYNQVDQKNVYHNYAGMMIKEKNSQEPFHTSSYPMSNLYIRNFLSEGETLFQEADPNRYVYSNNEEKIDKFVGDLPNSKQEALTVTETYRPSVVKKGSHSLSLLDESFIIPRVCNNANYVNGWGIRLDAESALLTFNTEKVVDVAEIKIESEAKTSEIIQINGEEYTIDPGNNQVKVKNFPYTDGRIFTMQVESKDFNQLIFKKLTLFN